MARLLWLADVLRGAGLTVHEYTGWRERGAERRADVRGVICHGTGGSVNSTDTGEIRTIAITGSNTATAPIAELYQSRSGAWWVLASGVCTGVKTGTGGPLKGYADTVVLQIEAQHHPTEPWTEVQYRSYVVGVAALVRHLGLAVEMVIGHGEHQPGEKTDPWFDMAKFRRDVAAAPNGDDMLPEQAAQLAALYHAFIPDPPKRTQGSWTSTGPDGRSRPINPLYSALDQLAEMLERIAAKVDVDPADLAAIKEAARAGAEAGVVASADELVAAFVAALPDDVASRADVVSALTEVLTRGTGATPVAS